jgi:hypothetical protein
VSENFHVQVCDFIDRMAANTGIHLDLQLSSQAVRDAVHVDIDPALAAIVRTELLLGEQMVVDLRELVRVDPPVEGGNLFITFRAGSARLQVDNAIAFGLHLTRLPLTDEVRSVFAAGVFVPGAGVEQAYQLFLYLKDPAGGINLAKTGLAIGLEPGGRLVSYVGFTIGRNLTISGINPPSRLADADRQVLLHVFLALSAFMTVHQGEAPLRRLAGGSVVIG